MSMTDLTVDLDDLERVAQELLQRMDGDAARIAEFEGGPVIAVSTREFGRQWYVVANERPEHAPGLWNEVAGLQVSRVDDPENELCQGCEFGYTSPSCAVHGAQRSEGLV